jgi:O-antigen/teichoic acid export membrane protein
VFGEAWRGLLVLGFGAAAALTVLAGPAIVLVYGQGFEPAATVLRALAWLLPVRFLNSLCATTLNATTWRRHQAAALGGAVGLNLLANIALVPVFGMWGAVYAAAASEAILLVVLVVALRKLLPSLVGQFAGAVLAVVPVGAVATMIPGHVVVRAAGAGLALAAVALATGALDVLGARVPGRMGDTLAQLAGTLHR